MVGVDVGGISVEVETWPEGAFDWAQAANTAARLRMTTDARNFINAVARQERAVDLTLAARPATEKPLPLAKAAA
jgi:hypothetical protein